MIEFDYIINDIPCTVHADDFFEDASVYQAYGPDDVWAESTADGTEVWIPDELLPKLCEMAVGVVLDTHMSFVEDLVRDW